MIRAPWVHGYFLNLRRSELRSKTCQYPTFFSKHFLDDIGMHTVLNRHYYCVVVVHHVSDGKAFFVHFSIKNRQYNCNIKLINENEFKTLDGNGNWKKNLNEFETAKNRKSFHFSRFERRNNQASIKSPIIHFIAHIIHFNSISNKTVDPSLLLLKPLEICFSSIWWTVLNFRPANIQSSPPNHSKV